VIAQLDPSLSPPGWRPVPIGPAPESTGLTPSQGDLNLFGRHPASHARIELPATPRRLRPQTLSTFDILTAALLCVVAGVLMVPLWSGLRARPYIAEALKSADTMKMVVLEAATVNGGLENIRAADLHYNPRAANGPYVEHAEIADGGLITLQTRNTDVSPAPILLLIPKEQDGKPGGEITWTCKLVLGNDILSPPDCPTHSVVAMGPML